MRNLLCYLLIPLFGYFSYSQNKSLLFGFEEIPQSLLVNPATPMHQDYHFGIPFLSQIHFNGGASGVSVYDIFGGSNIDLNTRIRNQIYKMKETDFFTVNQQLELLNFGWRDRKGAYFSGGIYEELDFIFYFPKDLAILAWEGNRDHIGESFNLGQISGTAELLTVFHFGINKKVSKKLTLGGRAKIYSSIAHAKTTNNSGDFITTIGDGTTNIYEHHLVNVGFTIQTSGLISLDEGDPAKKFLGRALLGGNLGLGFDVGANYEINRNWSLSASLIDVGAVFHTKDVETYESFGNHQVDGIEFLFPVLGVGDETFEYYDQIEDDFDDNIPLITQNESYVQFRPVKFYASVSYNFGEPNGTNDCNCLNGNYNDYKWRESLGLQVYSIARPKGPQATISAYYYRKITKSVSAKIAYTVDQYSASNLGFALSADMGWFNFYFTTDNILRYQNLAKAKNLSLQLGFNLKIDKK